MTKTKSIAIHIPGPRGARFIGTWNEERRLFVKNVQESKHLFRKLDAWGIDHSFYEKTLKAKGATIRVIDTETKSIYQASAAAFEQFGVLHHFERDADHGAQIFLARKFWTYTVRQEDGTLETRKAEAWKQGDQHRFPGQLSKEDQELWDSVPETPPEILNPKPQWP